MRPKNFTINIRVSRQVKDQVSRIAEEEGKTVTQLALERIGVEE